MNRSVRCGPSEGQRHGSSMVSATSAFVTTITSWSLPRQNMSDWNTPVVAALCRLGPYACPGYSISFETQIKTNFYANGSPADRVYLIKNSY